jgi:hypothetical protein
LKRRKRQTTALPAIDIDTLDFSTFNTSNPIKVTKTQALQMAAYERKRIKALKTRDCLMCAPHYGGVCPGICQLEAQTNSISRTQRRIGYVTNGELPEYPYGGPSPRPAPINETEKLVELQEAANEAMKLSLREREAEERLETQAAAALPKPSNSPKADEKPVPVHTVAVSNTVSKEKPPATPGKKLKIPPIGAAAEPVNPFPGILEDDV